MRTLNHCRYLKGGRYTRFSKEDDQRPDFEYRRPYCPRITARHVAELKSSLAPILLSIVNEDLAAIYQARPSPVIPMPRSPAFGDKCDGCQWSFGFVCWICQQCGNVFCLKCLLDDTSPHQSVCCHVALSITSAIDPVKLKEIQSELESFRADRPTSLVDASANLRTRKIPVVDNPAALPSCWSSGYPIIVRNPPGLQLDWSFEGLADQLGNDSCVVEDCENSSHRRKTTVRAFLQEMMELPESPHERVYKLKDYPPKSSFKTKHPLLAQDFQLALPAAAYTSDKGPLNITNYYPTNYTCTPDLGPKMYVAMANEFENDRHGSTRLHMDMADAVNIMAHGSATWHIFASQDSARLKEFMRNRFKLPPTVDPIHCQTIYMGPAALEDLEDRYNIKPFTFVQSTGEAVFIPAGCAHQVSNLTHCIKIAVDFLSPQSLQRCSQVTAELRACDTAQDCLEFANLIIHTWMALDIMSKALQTRQTRTTEVRGYSPLVHDTHGVTAREPSIDRDWQPPATSSSDIDMDSQNNVGDDIAHSSVRISDIGGQEVPLHDMNRTPPTPILSSDDLNQSISVPNGGDAQPLRLIDHPDPSGPPYIEFPDPTLQVAPGNATNSMYISFAAPSRAKFLGKQKEKRCKLCRLPLPTCRGSLRRRYCARYVPSTGDPSTP
ncbi:hypothetical protein AB1N83_005700 [Pleurotus pulmonarius]